mgnify:CR=1 FL=1
MGRVLNTRPPRGVKWVESLSQLKGGGDFLPPPPRPALPPSLETSPQPTLLLLESCSTTPRINLGVALKTLAVRPYLFSQLAESAPGRPEAKRFFIPPMYFFIPVQAITANPRQTGLDWDKKH